MDRLTATERMGTQKQALREVMRQRRRSVMPAEASEAGVRAAALLEPQFAERDPRCALLYSPLPGELDTAPLDHELRQRGCAIAYPRVAEEGRLELHLARPEELVPGRFAIREPRCDSASVSPEELDLVIVPGLAFDRAGRRLGFGRGYYDRLLASVPRALRYGVGLGHQLVEAVPAEPHDERLDFVVTDQLYATDARDLRILGAVRRQTEVTP